jgi:hypothetical protein
VAIPVSVAVRGRAARHRPRPRRGAGTVRQAAVVPPPQDP